MLISVDIFLGMTDIRDIFGGLADIWYIFFGGGGGRG